MKRTAAEHARRNMVKRNRAVTSLEAASAASETVAGTETEQESEEHEIEKPENDETVSKTSFVFAKKKRG